MRQMPLKRGKIIEVKQQNLLLLSFTAPYQVAGPALVVLLAGGRKINYTTMNFYIQKYLANRRKIENNVMFQRNAMNEQYNNKLLVYFKF